MISAILLFCGVSFASENGRSFKLFIEESGVYSVGYEELLDAGLEPGEYALSEISLLSHGKEKSFWIEGETEEYFGPGDRLVFVGKQLKGDYSYLDEYSAYNCYFLRFGGSGSSPGTTLTPPALKGGLDALPIMVKHHLEKDVVMVRFREEARQPQERWFWSRMAVTDRDPFRLKLKLDHFWENKPDAAALRRLRVVEGQEQVVRERLGEIFSPAGEIGNFTLRLAFKGWSVARNKPEGFDDHEILVRVGGKEIGLMKWNGRDPHVEDFEVSGDLAREGKITVEFEVVRRKEPKTGNLFVDVVLLNWLEIEYRRSEDFEEGQSRIDIMCRKSEEENPSVETGDGALSIRLEGVHEGFLYLSSDERIALAKGFNEIPLAHLLQESVFVIAGKGLRPVVRIVKDRPSNLKVKNRQEDYLLLTHESMLSAVQPLVEYHRRQGLKVAVIEVEDIYDEFHWGIPHPLALRDFFSWAYHEWEAPRPRFVLLAGDASWDWKNTTVSDSNYADWTYRPGEVWNFVKNGSTPYAEEVSVNHRNLVPTWGYRSSEGHAASDNYLVCVEGDDDVPDFAVGRIPVASPKEMEKIVAKTIAYDSKPPEGDWRKKILFITNESKGFQRSSDKSGEHFQELGFEIEKVYPNAEETANDTHTQHLLDIFDRGLLMVQFMGHGGRYIWRTGPPDLKKNHDLFTLENLDQLKPSVKLPFVISLTCYSAPFDHPTADSIGEKLLRLPDKGAIAVFAASWRNSPSSTMGRIVMEELSRPGATIGEAIVRAKAQLRNAILLQTYNLLGDPAIHLAVSPEVGDVGSSESVGGGKS